MDRYQRVEKPREETPINENEIRITAQGRMRNYISYATSLLQEKGSNEIVLKAMGKAISKTVMIVELIKRRIVGLHQNAVIGSTDITDTWEPLEEGLLPLETTRHVSVISITLSRKELDTSAVGYQPPLPRDLVRPLAEYDYEGEGYPGQGRGRGARGWGRAHGNGPTEYDDGNWDDRGRGYGRGGWGRAHRNVPTEYDNGSWDDRGRGYGRGGYGRGRVQGYRGRGRGGYGGQPDYQQESNSYAYNDEVPMPNRGRGRDRGRGRGRGPTRGRGRNTRPNGIAHAGTVVA
ncbi:ATP-dependent RNA helicase A-like [Zingiber officinale]|uniref:ATP-dependent RNA helicase A-like n=1 Tax=Zingiber officinale TaxID=94328 RepID=UPI001C4D299F|nr:ATP-dependent RNA helicase A-like [Zingiber officinale]XP_042468809.1 ATP-dependent RNA helicase A-like [Zingiber officinale]